MQTAVRAAPGIGTPRKPMASISRMTAVICASLASFFMTMSMIKSPGQFPSRNASSAF